MLREIGNVHQQDPALRRRWFCDDYFDIFVWEKPGGAIVEIQLCYDRTLRERVLRWRDSAGFAHHGIDGGDQSLFKNMTPIMVADGVFPLTDVLERFDARATHIEPRIRDFIRERLLDYRPDCGAELDKPATGG
ncbi:MAG: hypothetical protein ABL891_14900 [Burkholderiales bacterium]